MREEESGEMGEEQRGWRKKGSGSTGDRVTEGIGGGRGRGRGCRGR